MCIEIKTGKAVQGKRRARKILGVKCLSWDELPDEYTTNIEKNRVWMSKDRNILHGMGCSKIGGALFSLVVGETYSEEKFQNILSMVREAGEHLASTPHVKGWSGVETFKV